MGILVNGKKPKPLIYVHGKRDVLYRFPVFLRILRLSVRVSIGRSSRVSIQ